MGLSRRQFLGQAGAALASLSLVGATSGASERPNFLVIMTDDQPYYTVPLTKSVVSMIGDPGTTFSPYAYVSTPACGPARATLLTGKWSHNTGLTKTKLAYQELHASAYESDTIATRLAQAGYRTYFGKISQTSQGGCKRRRPTPMPRGRRILVDTRAN
jgi:arylsulfatase A-like enzyme